LRRARAGNPQTAFMSGASDPVHLVADPEFG
jgi:hypothetical protein